MTDLALPSGWSALFWGVLTFSLLVVVHEGGHFLAARFFGTKVHEFMIGLPGPSLSWRSKKSGVRYGITAIPLGGYVRIAGMEPGEEDDLLAEALGYAVDIGRADSSDLAVHLGVSRERATAILATLAEWGAVELAEGDDYVPTIGRDEAMSDDALLDSARAVTYHGRTTWQRVVILLMGVVLNILTALLIFTLTLSVWGYDVATRDIGSVQRGSAAEAAGLQVGDRIVSVNGTKVAEWNDFPAVLADLEGNSPVELVVSRGGEDLVIQAITGSSNGHAFLGVGPGVERKRFSVPAAFMESLKMTGLVFAAIAGFFNPETFATSVQGARSVVGISYEVAAAAEAGPMAYAWMIGLLSLSLGALNVLPLPPLDGGKVLVEIIERVRRRPLRKELNYALSAVGAVLLFSLIFYLMYADVMRYIVNG